MADAMETTRNEGIPALPPLQPVAPVVHMPDKGDGQNRPSVYEDEDGGYALKEFSTVVLVNSVKIPGILAIPFAQRGAAKHKTRSKKVFQVN